MECNWTRRRVSSLQLILISTTNWNLFWQHNSVDIGNIRCCHYSHNTLPGYLRTMSGPEWLLIRCLAAMHLYFFRFCSRQWINWQWRIDAWMGNQNLSNKDDLYFTTQIALMLREKEGGSLLFHRLQYYFTNKSWKQKLNKCNFTCVLSCTPVLSQI